MRGCDCRRICVRSETVSSASASRMRMRTRASSPAALRAALKIVERQVGRHSRTLATLPSLTVFSTRRSITEMLS